MARIPYLDLAAVAGPLGERLRQRPPLNLFRVLAHAPGVADGFLALGQAVLRNSSLPAPLRELVILRVGALCDAHYEVHQHRKLAHSAGVPNTVVESVLARADGPSEWHATGLGEAECAALAFTDATVHDVKASDAIYAALARHFPPAQQLEIIITIGFYLLVCRLLENLEVELEAVDVENLELRHA